MDPSLSYHYTKSGRPACLFSQYFEFCDRPLRGTILMELKKKGIVAERNIVMTDKAWIASGRG
jgi:hypothetical protein